MATLLETWRSLAYGDGLDDKKKEELWTNYFTIEKGIYEKILSNPTEVVEGTVKELAEKYGTEVLIMSLTACLVISLFSAISDSDKSLL